MAIHQCGKPGFVTGTCTACTDTAATNTPAAAPGPDAATDWHQPELPNDLVEPFAGHECEHAGLFQPCPPAHR